MYIPDPIEQMESSAERAYFEMLQPDGSLKCGCGKLFKEDEGIVMSPNPYAMPVCPDCADEIFQANETNP